MCVVLNLFLVNLLCCLLNFEEVCPLLLLLLLLECKQAHNQTYQNGNYCVFDESASGRVNVRDKGRREAYTVLNEML